MQNNRSITPSLSQTSRITKRSKSFENTAIKTKNNSRFKMPFIPIIKTLKEELPKRSKICKTNSKLDKNNSNKFIINNLEDVSTIGKYKTNDDINKFSGSEIFLSKILENRLNQENEEVIPSHLTNCPEKICRTNSSECKGISGKTYNRIRKPTYIIKKNFFEENQYNSKESNPRNIINNILNEIQRDKMIITSCQHGPQILSSHKTIQKYSEIKKMKKRLMQELMAINNIPPSYFIFGSDYRKYNL